MSRKQLVHAADRRGDERRAAGEDLVGFLWEAHATLRRIAVAANGDVERAKQERDAIRRKHAEVVHVGAVRNIDVAVAGDREVGRTAGGAGWRMLLAFSGGPSFFFLFFLKSLRKGWGGPPPRPPVAARGPPPVAT